MKHHRWASLCRMKIRKTNLEIVIYLHNNQFLHWSWVENFEVEPEAGRTRENVKNRDIFPAVQQIASPA
ncbi:hypothetical protein T12_15326 [Trichinella patagoniensis]|uniref:Uncharacterized protein n=1 Tax=Trichinella patagoniensis TaxID=990121 RepID=A0A0V1A2V2_9BILA|nr:hypothetical protein T12_15326 [Trichinella patagoniensis]